MQTQEEEETRMIAQRTGTKTYTTFQPCENRHTSTRFTSSGDCVECYTIVQRQAQYTCDLKAIAHAIASHKRSYATTYPCPHGHRTYRFTSTHDCYSCWKAYRDKQ